MIRTTSRSASGTICRSSPSWTSTRRSSCQGSPYDGLDRFAARERIVEDLRASGALVDIKEHQHAIALSQRTGEVIEPRLSMQWFIKIQPLADKAIEAVDKGYIRFTPENYKKTYDEWMRNIHDWCISRQLWWGHRIPAWHCGSAVESRSRARRRKRASTATRQRLRRRPTCSTRGSAPACCRSLRWDGTATTRSRPRTSRRSIRPICS